MDKKQLWKDLGTDPKERLKSLSDYASSVVVDPHIPVHRLEYLKLYIYKHVLNIIIYTA